MEKNNQDGMTSTPRGLFSSKGWGEVKRNEGIYGEVIKDRD